MDVTATLKLVKPQFGEPVVTGETATGQPNMAWNLDTIDSAIATLQQTPGTPPSVAAIPTTGLIGQFRMLAAETPAALVDASGSGNNATGTVGTPPTIIAGSGGVLFSGAGAVALPAALNQAKTIIIFSQFNHNAPQANGNTIPYVQPLQSLIQGNDNTFVSGIGKACGITLRGGAARDIWGNILSGGRQVRALYPQNGNLYTSSSLGIFEGVGSVALVQAATDLIYINGVPQRLFQSAYSSAGGQTAGFYQLGGCASGLGLQNFTTYLTSSIFYALFYNRVLTPQEITQCHMAMAAELALRGIVVSVGGGLMPQANLTGFANAPDVTPQVVFRGDSLTAGANAPYWYDNLRPSGVGGQALQLSNQGLSGDAAGSLTDKAAATEVDPLLRSAALGNLCFEWMGANDNSIIFAGFIKQWCIDRRAKGWKAIPVSMLSHSGELGGAGVGFNPTFGGDVTNDFLRRTHKTIADGFLDAGGVPNLGTIGAYLNARYFPDGVHPSGEANQKLLAPLFTRMIDRAFGNNDFSSAYTASANSGPAFEQGGFISGNVGTFGSFGFTKANKPGSLLIALFHPQAAVPTSVTDSNNNTWTQLQNMGGGGNVIWYAHDVKGGLNTVYFQFGAANASYLKAVFAEYSGVTGAFMQQATANGSSTSANSGNITTAVGGALILGIGFDLLQASVFSASGLFTKDLTGGNSTFMESQVQATAGAIAATASASPSATWYIEVVSFAPNNGQTYLMQDRDVCLKANPAVASLNVILIPATGLTGQRIRIKNTQVSGANTVTLVPTPLAITNIAGNGTTATATVPSTVGLIAGMSINITGATSAGFSGAQVVATVPSATTFTFLSALNVTEAEPAACQLINEFIDGATSLAVPNNSEVVLESLINSNTAIRGGNWTVVTD